MSEDKRMISEGDERTPFDRQVDEAADRVRCARRDAREEAMQSLEDTRPPASESKSLIARVAHLIGAALAGPMLADAWDEGRDAGFRDAYVDEEQEEANPYRSQT